MPKKRTKDMVPEQLTQQSLQERYDNYDRFKIMWLDTRPDLPLSQGPGVMRWDLRPDDWNKIWPDLLFHPCAYMNAQQHPLRVGAPSPIDMVRTFPNGFDWKASAPLHMHEAIAATVAKLEDNPDLGAPVGKVLAASGTLYSIDTVGRPFAIGVLSMTEQGVDVQTCESLPKPRAHIAPSPKPADLLDHLCTVLDHVAPTERARLSELMSVLVRAPDSPSTKKQIAAIIEQTSKQQGEASESVSLNHTREQI
jgi:hypothetical protein